MWKALVLSTAVVLPALAGATWVAGEDRVPSARTEGVTSVDGTVTKVDAENGVIQVKTSNGTLVVRFLTSDFPDVRPGDRIKLFPPTKDAEPTADR